MAPAVGTLTFLSILEPQSGDRETRLNPSQCALLLRSYGACFRLPLFPRLPPWAILSRLSEAANLLAVAFKQSIRNVEEPIP
jgi:hypothetical protein